MSNELFTTVSVEQQETVAGGFSFNFANTAFFAQQSPSNTSTISLADGGSATTSTLEFAEISTGGTTFNGFDLPADFLAGLLG